MTSTTTQATEATPTHDPTNPSHVPVPGDWRELKPGVKDLALSALAWTTAGSWLVSWASVLTPLHLLVGPHRKAVDQASRVFTRGMVAATFSSWKAWVHPEVRDDEQYIFAQNHVNHFDFVTMYAATPHFKQGLELETHFRYPVYGQFMKSRGTIPVPADRANRFPAVREGMRRELAQGRSVLAFPEGTRTLNGRVGPFRKGVFVAARDIGAKVAPTAVCGMYEVMRKGSLLIRPFGDVRVYIEKPVDFAGVSDEELPAKIAEVRDAIVRRVDEYAREKHGWEAQR